MHLIPSTLNFFAFNVLLFDFYNFFKEIYPGQFEPSRSHKFIRLLETHEKLLRNYTQNIDTLEQVAGIERVIQCHGKIKFKLKNEKGETLINRQDFDIEQY